MDQRLPIPVPEFPPLPVQGPGSALAAISPGDRIRRVNAVLQRRWPVFLLVFLAVLGGVAAYTFLKTPEYSATATMLVNQRTVRIASKENEAIPAADDEDRAINAEIQILQSTDVGRRVVDAIAAGNPRWLTLLTKLPLPEAREAALDAIQSRLRVDRPGGANVLSVAFTSPDPRLSAFAANAYANAYLTSKVDARLAAARSVDQSLQHELEAMRGRVEQAEAAVAAYRREHNLLSADGVTLTEREQSLYKQQQAESQTALAEEQARLQTARQQLRRGSIGDDVGEALNSPVINGLRAQRAEASAKLAQLQSRYGPEYPSVADAKRQVADIDSAIQAEIGRVMSNLEARVQVAQRKAGSAGGIVARAQGELASNTGAAVRLNELERRAEALRTNYAGLLQRQTAVAAQAVVADSDARILSPARTPWRPATPNKKLNLVLGTLLAGLVAAGAVAALQLFDQRLISSDEVEETLGLPHLANVPELSSIAGKREGQKAADFVIDRPYSLIAEAMRGLLLLIDRYGTGGSTRIIGVTSATPREGKSTLVACLARVSAMSGRRTLVIEGDVRRPSLAAQFDIVPKASFIDVLAGRAKLEDCIIEDKRSGAWILPAIAQSAPQREVGVEKAIDALMTRVQGVFDVVIIDTAPALAAYESRLLMRFAEHPLLVLRWKHTRAPAARAALKRLRAVGVEPMGVVMTRVNMRAVAAYGVGDVDQNYRELAGYFQ